MLLDNFEHLIASAPMVAAILRATAELKIVVTSRAPLHVSGEQEFEVPPLQVPDQQCTTVGAVADCESVRLFTDRARAARAGFVLTGENAAAVAGIAQRLDGLPLALELAAARVKLLPPTSLLARLDQALPLLVGGARDLPERQQTLRGTIAWSYDLLGAGAKRLLATCSVFRGGISLESVESVCAPATGGEVLAGLEELVDQSMLRRVEGPGGPRFGMLAVVREYAAERLAEMPERARIEAGHAATFLALAQAAGPGLRGPGEREWLERLEAEHQNIRAALEWYQRYEPGEALRLTAAMSRFWGVRGHFTEGRERLKALLEASADATITRVKALNGAASLAIDQGDQAEAGDLLAESIQLSQQLGDRRSEAMALVYLGRSLIASDCPGEAGPHIDRALQLHEGLDDAAAMAIALARGIRARIIDQGDRVVLQSRALGIHARTLEVFDMMGLADRFAEHGQVMRRFHLYADGKTLIRLDLGRNESAYGFMLDVPQDETETILRQRVGELSCPTPATAAAGPRRWRRSSSWSASGPRSPRRYPIRPGWASSGVTGGPPASTGAAGSCWPATPCTSTARLAARA